MSLVPAWSTQQVQVPEKPTLSKEEDGGEGGGGGKEERKEKKKRKIKQKEKDGAKKGDKVCRKWNVPSEKLRGPCVNFFPIYSISS